jgi:hypothetical protein
LLGVAVLENARGLFCLRESWIKDTGRMATLGRLAQWLRAQSGLRCSFCGRTGDQVERLVAGPSVYICDECIKTCVAVLEQDGSSPSASR